MVLIIPTPSGQGSPVNKKKLHETDRQTAARNDGVVFFFTGTMAPRTSKSSIVTIRANRKLFVFQRYELEVVNLVLEMK